MRECKENDRRNNTASWDVLNGNRWMALRAVMGYSHYAGEGRENTPSSKREEEEEMRRMRDAEKERERKKKERKKTAKGDRLTTGRKREGERKNNQINSEGKHENTEKRITKKR